MIYNEEFETLAAGGSGSAAVQEAPAGRPAGLSYTVGFYRKAFDDAGVKPEDVKSLADLKRLPLHHQAGPAGQLSLRHVRRPHEQCCPSPCLLRNDRPGHRGGLYETRHRTLVRADGPLLRRRRADKERHHPQRLRLRALHGRPRRPLWGGAAGGQRHPHLGSNTKRQIMILQDFGPTAICCTPLPTP